MNQVNHRGNSESHTQDYFPVSTCQVRIPPSVQEVSLWWRGNALGLSRSSATVHQCNSPWLGEEPSPPNVEPLSELLIYSLTFCYCSFIHSFILSFIKCLLSSMMFPLCGKLSSQHLTFRSHPKHHPMAAFHSPCPSRPGRRSSHL